MKYSTQKVIEILENKGFSIKEDPENDTLIRCRRQNCKEIVFKESGNGHWFKVLTNYTTNLKKALEFAGVKNLEDVA